MKYVTIVLNESITDVNLNIKEETVVRLIRPENTRECPGYAPVTSSYLPTFSLITPSVHVNGFLLHPIPHSVAPRLPHP